VPERRIDLVAMPRDSIFRAVVKIPAVRCQQCRNEGRKKNRKGRELQPPNAQELIPTSRRFLRKSQPASSSYFFGKVKRSILRAILPIPSTSFKKTDLLPNASVPVLSHEILAEMVGTTRARITHFMNKFRTMGLIDYNGDLTIRTELLTDLLLHD
jgi:Crp-like helix-turn-helix domain